MVNNISINSEEYRLGLRTDGWGRSLIYKRKRRGPSFEP
jgi:hypothetical protein